MIEMMYKIKEFGVSKLVPHKFSYRSNLAVRKNRLTFECLAVTGVRLKPGQFKANMDELAGRIMKGSADLAAQNLCMLYFSMADHVRDRIDEPFINPYIDQNDLKTYVERINRHSEEVFNGLDQLFKKAASFGYVNSHARLEIVIKHFIETEVKEAFDSYRKHLEWLSVTYCENIDNVYSHERNMASPETRDYHHFRVMLTPISLLAANLPLDMIFWDRLPEQQRWAITGTIKYLISNGRLEKEKVSSFLSVMDELKRSIEKAQEIKDKGVFHNNCIFK
jgi:hypothetical protein